MPSVTVPNERDKQIMRENHLDPNNYGVLYRDADYLERGPEMVRIDVGPNICRGQAMGDTDTVAAELALGIGAIYQSIKMAEGEATAERFKTNLIIVLAPDCPAWDADDGMIVIKKTSGTPTDQS